MPVDTPTVPTKISFKWKLIYIGIAGFAWELVPDPDAVGTVAKPFEWFAGYHYTTIPTALTLRFPYLKTKGF